MRCAVPAPLGQFQDRGKAMIGKDKRMSGNAERVIIDAQCESQCGQRNSGCGNQKWDLWWTSVHANKTDDTASDPADPFR